MNPADIMDALTVVLAPYVPYITALVAVCSVLDAALPQPKPGSHLLIPRKLISFVAVNFGSAANGSQPSLASYKARLIQMLFPVNDGPHSATNLPTDPEPVYAAPAKSSISIEPPEPRITTMTSLAQAVLAGAVKGVEEFVSGNDALGVEERAAATAVMAFASAPGPMTLVTALEDIFKVVGDLKAALAAAQAPAAAQAQ